MLTAFQNVDRRTTVFRFHNMNFSLFFQVSQNAYKKIVPMNGITIRKIQLMFKIAAINANVIRLAGRAVQRLTPQKQQSKLQSALRRTTAFRPPSKTQSKMKIALRLTALNNGILLKMILIYLSSKNVMINAELRNNVGYCVFQARPERLLLMLVAVLLKINVRNSLKFDQN